MCAHASFQIPRINVLGSTRVVVLCALSLMKYVEKFTDEYRYNNLMERSKYNASLQYQTQTVLNITPPLQMQSS